MNFQGWLRMQQQPVATFTTETGHSSDWYIGGGRKRAANDLPPLQRLLQTVGSSLLVACETSYAAFEGPAQFRQFLNAVSDREFYQLVHGDVHAYFLLLDEADRDDGVRAITTVLRHPPYTSGPLCIVQRRYALGELVQVCRNINLQAGRPIFDTNVYTPNYPLKLPQDPTPLDWVTRPDSSPTYLLELDKHTRQLKALWNRLTDFQFRQVVLDLAMRQQTEVCPRQGETCVVRLLLEKHNFCIRCSEHQTVYKAKYKTDELRGMFSEPAPSEGIAQLLKEVLDVFDDIRVYFDARLLSVVLEDGTDCVLMRSGLLLYNGVEQETRVDLGLIRCMVGLLDHPSALINEALPLEKLLLYNRKYAVVTFHTQTAVFDFGRHVFTSFEHFRNKRLYDKVESDEDKPLSVVNLWLNHPLARHYDEVLFRPVSVVWDLYLCPGAKLNKGALSVSMRTRDETYFSDDGHRTDETDRYTVWIETRNREGTDRLRGLNVWKGWPAVDKADPASLVTWEELLRDGICGSEPELEEYVLNWMAHAVQFPGSKPRTALVLTGNQGTGKGCFAQWLGACFGTHFAHLTQGQHLTGHFNSHMHDKILVFADEATFGGDKVSAGVIKALITEETATLERKGVDAVSVRSYVKLIIASNTDHPVHLENSDRRFVTIATTDRFVGETAFFSRIDREMRYGGGMEALLLKLATRDIQGFDPSVLPTLSVRLKRHRFELMQCTWKTVTHFVYNALNRCDGMQDDRHCYDFCGRRVDLSEVHSAYLIQQRERTGGNQLQYEGGQEQRFWREFRSIFASDPRICTEPAQHSNGKRYRVFPSRRICREAFQKYVKLDDTIWDVTTI